MLLTEKPLCQDRSKKPAATCSIHHIITGAPSSCAFLLQLDPWSWRAAPRHTRYSRVSTSLVPVLGWPLHSLRPGQRPRVRLWRGPSHSPQCNSGRQSIRLPTMEPAWQRLWKTRSLSFPATPSTRTVPPIRIRLSPSGPPVVRPTSGSTWATVAVRKHGMFPFTALSDWVPFVLILQIFLASSPQSRRVNIGSKGPLLNALRLASPSVHSSLRPWEVAWIAGEKQAFRTYR